MGEKRQKQDVFELLRHNRRDRQTPITFSPNPAYEAYLKIHKVLVGEASVSLLESIATTLGKEELPRYVFTAGWASFEASLATTEQSATKRMSLLDNTEEYWTRALEAQVSLQQNERDASLEYSAPHRTAACLARLPLARGLVAGNITDATRIQVREDTLAIAAANLVQLELANKSNNIDAVADHLGAAYEFNALVGFDSLDTPGLIALPSSERNGSGHHHPAQTHDIMLIQQSWGLIKSITPIEIKSAASRRDRERYKSLIMRGKMHLSLPGNYSPADTLVAFQALYEGKQTATQQDTTNFVRGKICDMLWRYRKGEKIENLPNSTPTEFHEKSMLAAIYPEIVA